MLCFKQKQCNTDKARRNFICHHHAAYVQVISPLIISTLSITHCVHSILLSPITSGQNPTPPQKPATTKDATYSIWNKPLNSPTVYTSYTVFHSYFLQPIMLIITTQYNKNLFSNSWLHSKQNKKSQSNLCILKFHFLTTHPFTVHVTYSAQLQ